jgi:hypothetical protein
MCSSSVVMLSKAHPTRQAKVCSAATVARAIKLRARRYSTSPWPRTSPLSSREIRIFSAMGDAGLLFGPFQSSVAETSSLFLVCSLSLFPFKSNSNSLFSEIRNSVALAVKAMAIGDASFSIEDELNRISRTFSPPQLMTSMRRGDSPIPPQPAKDVDSSEPSLRFGQSQNGG